MWARKCFLCLVRAWLLITVLFLPTKLFSEELLIPLTRNPYTKKVERTAITKAPQSLLGIPFLDDFSRNTGGLPVSTYWSKAQVFVNDGYGVQAPTPFVATFDVLNDQGEMYDQASYDFFSADTLTSQPIALSAYSASDSITLYFQIQAGGKGSFPSDGDTLCLEFFDPVAQTWQVAWSAHPYTISQTPNSLIFKNWLNGKEKEYFTGDTTKITDVFFPVLIPVPSALLSDGFAFRFRNVGSLSRLDAVPGIVGNTDHWNLGLVYLNKRDANDTTFFRDVLLMKPAKSVLRNYSAMPWRHFKGNSAAQLLLMDDDRVQSIKMTYRSAHYRPLQVSRQFFIEELMNPTNTYHTDALWDRLETDESYEYVYRGYDFAFSSDAADSVDFCVRSVLSYTGAQAPFTTNDTLSYIQHFKDYYAYDDGQAENGYGLFGRWAGGSMVAIKYTNQLSLGDTLKGVYMYFNRSYQGANKLPLKLAVWNDFNGYPGTRIYDTLSVEPALEYGTGGWEYFALTKPLVVRGDFYVGWEQVGENMLNIGFDQNCTIVGKHYINEGAGWALSAYNGKGLPMIRPAFGHVQVIPTGIEATPTRTAWSIYPNPSSGSVFIEPKSILSGNYQVRVFSLRGELLRAWQASPARIELDNLTPGIYVIRIDVPGMQPFAQPIIKK